MLHFRLQCLLYKTKINTRLINYLIGDDRSRDSSVGMAIAYEMEDGGVGVQAPVRQEFSFLHVVQKGSWVHPTFYKRSTGVSFLEVKRPGREADQSPPTSAEVKKMWIYTSPPPHAFMA
jgi:hypothetical protein